MVYGKVEPGSDGGAISFAPPPREIPRDPEPVADEESNLVESEETADVAISASGEEAEAETEAGNADGRDDGTSIDREIPRE